MFWSKKLVNILVLDGVINPRGKKSLSLKNLQDNIDKAFANKNNTKAVVLLINSPGGSAAQSEIIANYIKSKSLATNIPVISFIEDVAASGGYFLAVAASEIYAMAKSSIVGSIGVIYSGFGLEDFITRHGIKRRIYTAGNNKAILDMFNPEKPEDVEIIHDLLHETHEHFKSFVKDNRPGITLSEEELFSGKFWLASTALKYKIIDGIVPDINGWLKDKFGKKIKINTIKSKRGILASLFSFKVKIEPDFMSDMLGSIELNEGIKTLK